MSDLELLPVSEMCESIDYGFTASATDKPNGPRFLRITDIVGQNIVWNDVPYCVASPEERQKYKLNDGDVVIARTGATTGYSAYISNPPEAVFASYLVRLVVSKDHSSRFLSYALKSSYFWDHIYGVLGEKSAQPNASASTMASAKVPKLPLSTQRAIAHVLGTLDEKIELLRQMNETLEAMARALFKSWFVDFDPVRKKADGLPTGLPKAIEDLFPSEFEDSELGEMPKGWKVGTLGLYGSNTNEKARINSLGSGTKYVGLEHIPRRSVTLSEFGDSQEVESEKSIFRKGDVLFGKLRPYFHKVVFAPFDGICSTDVLVVRPRKPSFFGFLLEHLSSSAVVDHATACSNGTKMPRAKWADLANYQVCCPPEELLERLNNVVSTKIQKIESNAMTMSTCSDLRDSLLPKLISGDLELTDDMISKILEPAK